MEGFEAPSTTKIYRESYPGYTEIRPTGKEEVQRYFPETIIKMPRFFVLSGENEKTTKIPFKKDKVNLSLLAKSIIFDSPQLWEFAIQPDRHGKFDRRHESFFLRKNFPHVVKHELTHSYTAAINPEIVETILKGHLISPPTETPFIYQFINEGIAELVSIDIGLGKTGEERDEAQTWLNFRLRGEKKPGEAPPSKDYVLAKFVKSQEIIDKYKKEAINPKNAFQKDQYDKAFAELADKIGPEDSSPSYTLGLAYCMSKFQELTAQGQTKQEAIHKIIQFPPQTMAEIKEAIDKLAA